MSMSYNFGSLTTSTGQKLTFEDFDTDGDGVISEDEYEAAIKEYDLDSVELSTVDTDGDKTITEEEFQIWEQKAQMQETIEPYYTKITTDFTGSNSSYAKEMVAALNELIDTYAEEYIAAGNDISQMAETFAEDIDTQYETLKSNILNNTTEAVESRVVDSLLETADVSGLSDEEAEIYIQLLGETLEDAAAAYISSYTGDDLETDLTKYLTEYISSSEQDSIDISSYEAVVASFGTYIDSAELETLKEAAITLLTEALNAGLTVRLDGTKYNTEKAISTKVNKYTDASELTADMEEFIESLESESRTNVLIAEAKTELRSSDTYTSEAAEIKTAVIDDFIEEAKTSAAAAGLSDAEIEIYVQLLGETLEDAAASYISSYTGDDLKTDLTKYLTEYMAASEQDSLDVSSYESVVASFGTYIDSDELETLKEAAITLLTAALEAGISVTLGGSSYTSANSVTNAVNKYTDASELTADMETFIESVSSSSRTDVLIAQAVAQAEADEYENFISIAGSEYQISASLIDYSKIEGYYEDETITVKKQGSDGAKDDCVEFLKENLYDQMKSQIESMLASYGVSFDQVETIFDNVFTQSANETADAVVTGKHGTWFRSSKSSFDIQTAVDTFIETFNTNIAAAIDEMNASDTDMDLYDVDYASAVEAGLDDTDLTDEQKEDLINGGTITVKKKGGDYFYSIAESIIDNLEEQMLDKAKTMCEANGVEFDESVFETMFNNAKATAIVAAVSDSRVSLIYTSNTMDTSLLLETFTSTFKENYSEWVEDQKTE